MTEPELLAPIHPGEILSEEFLKPMKISQKRLAQDLNVTTEQINEIIQEKQGITAYIALRLSRYEVSISDLFLKEGATMTYIFDFGDWWEFDLKLEKIDTNDLRTDYGDIIESKGSAPE